MCHLWTRLAVDMDLCQVPNSLPLELPNAGCINP